MKKKSRKPYRAAKRRLLKTVKKGRLRRNPKNVGAKLKCALCNYILVDPIFGDDYYRRCKCGPKRFAFIQLCPKCKKDAKFYWIDPSKKRRNPEELKTVWIVFTEERDAHEYPRVFATQELAIKALYQENLQPIPPPNYPENYAWSFDGTLDGGYPIWMLDTRPIETE